MADITAAMVKDLRERTGAGMADCKKALVETEIDNAVVEKEREIKLEAARNPKAVPGEKLKVIPEAMIPKVVEGQLAKWKKEICLLDQIWVRDPEGKKTIATLLTELVSKIGENI